MNYTWQFLFPRNSQMMRQIAQKSLTAGLGMLLAVVAWNAAAGRVVATELVLKDGRVLRGKYAPTAGLAESPFPKQSDDGDQLQTIVVLDDNLRRTFVSQRLVREVHEEEKGQVDEKFVIRQKTLRAGQAISSVGPPLRIDPFDEFGRRTFTMVTNKGAVPVIQGITELTPQWTKVEGISHLWDERIATSTIPADVLQKILLKQIILKGKSITPEDFKKVARFYLQAERYKEARQVLEGLFKVFPDRADLREQLMPSIRAIEQLSARERLSELRLRRDAGQYRLVRDELANFPTEDVGGEVLQGVREMIEKYDTDEARRQDIIKHLNAISSRMSDTIGRENLKPILEEIAAEIGPNTIDRMAAFQQNADDAQTTDIEKIALAISGWLLGADSATVDLSSALAAYRVRRWIREYLCESVTLTREQAFNSIKQESSVDVAMVAGLLAHMKPPLDPPEPIAGKPGYYQIEVAGLAAESPVTYYVQLPPEYDPYRLYPTIVTLNGAGRGAELQVDWWAGAWGDGGMRAGQATRHGYIVVAPVWTVEHQRQYDYSAREHAAVLNSLRDACRRFAIDTDRVYLSGHSMGGDAAWDIGLAHPDLWAGVIPIVAQSDRYCSRYWENAQYVPFYVIEGELDGGKFVKNARDLDRYLKRGFDTTVVEFQGRGHEDFYDEILRLFDWMGHFRRDFFPRKFACKTMRSWDNYFWWVELQGLPPKSVVDPADWPAAGALPVEVKASINDKKVLNVQAGSSQVTVWLSPQMLDFKQRSTIMVNGRRLNNSDQLIRPDLQTMLKDVRSRGDRQHPFWARVDSATGRVHGG
jgi:pimeloyl-ACP methyl ester carboxylesterase